MTSDIQSGIEQTLQALPKAKAVAFAVRTALRSLPMLASFGNHAELMCWPPLDQARHLAGVLRASSIGVTWLLNPDAAEEAAFNDSASKAADDAERATSAAQVTLGQTINLPHLLEAAASNRFMYQGEAAAAAYYLAAGHAAQAANFAAASAAAASNAASASGSIYSLGSADSYGAATAARALDADGAARPEIMFDLQVLPSCTPREFFERPLWDICDDELWQPRYLSFQQVVAQLDGDFDGWLDWLAARYNGQALSA